MRKLLLLCLLISTPAFAAGNAVKVRVNGLVCDFCAQSISKLLKKEAAVEDAKIDLEAGLVSIQLKDGQTLDDRRIEDILKDSGYTVTGIERTS